MKVKAIEAPRAPVVINISKASKMPCPSWSLEAIETCPGSIDAGHESGLVEACRICYATRGNYRYPNVKKPRAENRRAWQHPDFVPAMVARLQDESFFRWFDSGDMYHIGLARKILEVMRGTPGTRHWLPTRMYKFSKFRAILDEMNGLPNVVARYSSDSITGATIPGAAYSSTIFPADHAPAGAFVCGAYTRAGKCADCRACWDKSISVIAYPGHGAGAKKEYKALDLVTVA